MPEFEMPLGDQQTWQALDEFTQGYWEAAFFTSQEELGDLSFADVSKEAYDRALGDCLSFQTENVALLDRAYARDDYSPTQAGRDFWYTRNGHGVGYWDRKTLSEDGLGDALSDACERHEIDLYIVNDKIYFMY